MHLLYGCIQKCFSIFQVEGYINILKLYYYHAYIKDFHGHFRCINLTFLF